MMVYARSISQMNQKKLGSQKKLETFTNVQLNNFILAVPMYKTNISEHHTNPWYDFGMILLRLEWFWWGQELRKWRPHFTRIYI